MATARQTFQLLPSLGRLTGKPRLSFCLAIAILYALFAQPSFAGIFYVDPAGNDSNSGTSPAAPWRTVAKVNASVFQPGDKVVFKSGGLWRETLQP